jgi:metallo-beta-lactamase family protein
LGGFSAHADQNGQLDWYGVMAPSRPRTILTHGENNARTVFSGLIKSRYGVDAECPAPDDVIEI